MTLTRWLCVLPIALASMDGLALAGGYTPEEARARMVLPPGFAAEVFASEPAIRQPVAACFDERGRMWVIEYLQYPTPAGLKPVTVDQYLRTEYDRVPEPPPKGPRGADRIKILEDTDGDGRADKVTTFVEGLNLASGLAVGHGGVFVGQAPYLLFYPDRDRDDRPDGDPEVLLSGFGLQDAHATVNSLGWGPDGWLYGAQGSTVTANIRGIGFQQGIWRYHPGTKAFELFAEGGGNTWGLDWDREGNAFGSSNGSYITFHTVQGGYYVKGFAKHGPLHNPRTYGYFDPISYDGPKVGGHVTPGGIIYKGDAYPESFRGTFIGGNLLSNAVYWHTLRPDGSTVRGKHGGTLIDARDPWFRPIDLLVGPDGCVYVVDWYDRRASHLDPRDTWDKTNGRIYRMVYGNRNRLPPFDLSKLSTNALIDLRSSPNDWQADVARRLLAERRDPSAIPRLRSLLKSDEDPIRSIRDLWALHVSGGLDDPTALAMLDHPVPAVRRWTVRLLGDDHRVNSSLLASLVHRASADPDPMVRSQLASSARRWPVGVSFAIVDALLERSEDATDRQIPLLLWWACESALSTDREAAIAHMNARAFLDRPLVRTAILERYARLLIASESDEAVAVLLGLARNEGEVDRIVSGLLKGLEGRKVAGIPPSLTEAIVRFPRGPKAPNNRRLLAMRLGNPDATTETAQLIADREASDSDRIAAIEAAAQVSGDRFFGTLLYAALSRPRPPVAAAALAALGTYDRPDMPVYLLADYGGLPAPTRTRVVDLLTTRKVWADQLVDAIVGGRVSAKEVTASQVRAIARVVDPAMRSRLESIWGRLPGSGSPEKVRRIAEVRGILPEGDKGSASRGRAVFKEHCAVCHRLFGEGETIGPDLTGAERGDLDFLLTSLVDPNALVRKEYASRTIVTKDGRVLDGLVVDENDRTITLVDSKRQRTTIAVADVESSRASDLSLMPEGVLDPLKDDQVRDLFRYLQSTSP